MKHKVKIISGIFAFIFLSLMVSVNLFPQTKDFVKFEIAKGYFEKGLKYFNNMQYLAAVEFFRNAVKEYPDYYTARDYLARSYKFAGFIDEALIELENYQRISPDNITITSKINNIRFRDSIPDTRFAYSNLILYNIYKSPDIKRFGFPKPVDIAVDNEKNMYITSFSSGRMVKIDSNGKGVSVSTPSMNGQLYGIDYYNNKLAVADFKNDLVFIINKNGDVLQTIGSPGSDTGKFHGPEGVCFDDRGYIYVVDSGNHRVQKFDNEGNFILAFGEKGEYAGQLNNPTDVVFYNNRIYVTDTVNKRLSCYDDSGNFINNIRVEGLEVPRGLMRSGDTLLISDEKRGLLFYDIPNGTSKWFNSWKGEKGNFSRLISSVVDRDEYLYCLDYNLESIFLFSPVQKRYSNLELEITSVDLNKFQVVAFYLNVRNRDGRPVYGLDSENFRITEDNAPISNIYVNYLKKMAPSVSLVLCVDRSKSNSGYHNDIPWVSDFILKKMKKNDLIKLVNFNNEVWEGNRFDWSRRRTRRALKKREYGKGKRIGTALYNSISDLLPKLNRRAVIFVTDGSVSDDSFQQYTPRNIIQYAKSHYIPIYIISFKKPHFTLVNIANESGGAVFRPGQLNKLRSIYDRIKKSEEYRYVLVYSSYKLPSFKGLWSDVKIEVDYRGQKGVEWGGYFIP